MTRLLTKKEIENIIDFIKPQEGIPSDTALSVMNKQKEEIKQIHQFLAREIENQMRDRDRIIDDVYRTMDSRLDKLESKLSSRKA